MGKRGTLKMAAISDGTENKREFSMEMQSKQYRDITRMQRKLTPPEENDLRMA